MRAIIPGSICAQPNSVFETQHNVTLILSGVPWEFPPVQEILMVLNVSREEMEVERDIEKNRLD